MFELRSVYVNNYVKIMCKQRLLTNPYYKSYRRFICVSVFDFDLFSAAIKLEATLQNP